jgi:hypothetical protein
MPARSERSSVIDDKKSCARCGRAKALDEFHKNSSAADGKCYDCKQCVCTYQKERYRASAAVRKKIISRSRARIVRRNFGLTVDELEEMRSSAVGCAICGGDDVSHADHNHDAVPGLRGFLCSHCNTGLGLFKDSASRLRAAAEYLEAAAS